MTDEEKTRLTTLREKEDLSDEEQIELDGLIEKEKEEQGEQTGGESESNPEDTAQQ